MDAVLRHYQRQAQQSNDADAWRQYAGALERVCDLAPKKLFAVLHREDLYGGELILRPSCYVDYVPGDDAETLFRRFLNRCWSQPERICETCIQKVLHHGYQEEDDEVVDHECEGWLDLPVMAECLAPEAWVFDETLAMILDAYRAGAFQIQTGNMAAAQQTMMFSICQTMALENIKLIYPFQAKQPINDDRTSPRTGNPPRAGYQRDW